MTPRSAVAWAAALATAAYVARCANYRRSSRAVVGEVLGLVMVLLAGVGVACAAVYLAIVLASNSWSVPPELWSLPW